MHMDSALGVTVENIVWVHLALPGALSSVLTLAGRPPGSCEAPRRQLSTFNHLKEIGSPLRLV